MAKFLAYKRSAQQVVTVDTINAVVADLGNAITGADTSNAFPNRSENMVCECRGDYYLLYRTTTNEVHLSRFDIGTATWADVAGFPAMTSGTGILTPLCLQVIKDRLIAIAELSVSAASDGVLVRRSVRYHAAIAALISDTTEIRSSLASASSQMECATSPQMCPTAHAAWPASSES